MTRFQLQPRRVENDFNKLFHNFFGNSQLPTYFREPTSDKIFSPNVNVAEHDDKISLLFELPGMDKSEIKVLVKDQVLTVSGERKIETEVNTDGYFRSEISTGAFSRSFNLPDTVKQDSVNADYKNGLLQIVLTKKEESKPKEIEIQVS